MVATPAMTRRALLQSAAAATLCAYMGRSLVFAPGADAAPWGRDAYLAYADRTVELVDDHWSASARCYREAGGGETSTNANLLLVHAVAAATGHNGRARQDARARALVRRLCETPPWHGPPPGKAVGIYVGGWRNTMSVTPASRSSCRTRRSR